MDDAKIDSILEAVNYIKENVGKISSISDAVNYIKEYEAKKVDLDRLVKKDDLESFKNQIIAKIESTRH
ncbi:MAG: hypothetical protein NT116_00770 [Candidatus Parcubacteria bacterium]|nr:hypothetical protein [Candidatus Parcubacteria bacterium]